MPINPPTVDLRPLLAPSIGAIGGVADWAIYIGKEPSEPVNVITLYDTPGGAPNPKWLVDEPRFQVRVRAVDYAIGWSKANAVRDLLLGLPSQTINGTRYVGVYVVIDTGFLMQDEAKRSIFVSTWRVIREPAEGANRRPL